MVRHEGFKVVFVEDEACVRDSLSQALELAGFEVCACASAEEARAILSPLFRGVVVSDVQLPGMDGLQFLRHLRKADAGVPIILVTGHGDVSMAVQAMREGAEDFIEKPFTPARLIESVGRAMDRRALQLEVEALRQQLRTRQAIASTLIGSSAAMQALRQSVLSLAGTSADVLVTGESGTGKELVAQCLHSHSRRSHGRFVAVNCGGIPENLFESEMFGHEAGAFTNAGKRRIGRLEHASGGTLLLDEVESMPLHFQVKLLRVLQERCLERLGSNTEIPVDFRLVAAAKGDLGELSRQGTFRSDLYYRLNVATLELPPLRERREDIPALFEHFVLQAALRYGREVPQVRDAELRELMAQPWPGNVRELRNVADRLVLGLALPAPAPAAPPHAAAPGQGLAEQLDQVEKAMIEHALRVHAGRSQEVCKALGLAKKTFYDKLHRHGLLIDDFRPAAPALRQR